MTRRCIIDHTVEGALPAFLCRTCNPRRVEDHRPAAPVAVQDRQRDYRIPKGMSDAEGEAMLARMAAERKAATQARIAKMKKSLAEREAEKLAEVNEARAARNLPPLKELDAKAKQRRRRK